MKAFKRVLLCFLAVFFFFGLAPQQAGAYSSDKFDITAYDVHTVVSENCVFDITETITVNFNVAQHGIYRTIPVNTEMKRTGSDGKTFTTTVPSDVYDVKVDGYKFSVSRKYNEVSIKIGDANTTVTGTKVYKISYKLRFGDDGVKTFDEVYYNIIGTEWDNKIDNATFSVTLPKSFDANKLGFSVGYKNATGYDPKSLALSVSGNTVTGRMTKPLDYYSGITMRLELPQGYFKVPDIRTTDWVLMGIIGFITLLTCVLFFLYGRDEKPVETVEFEAPDGMTPPEVAYVFNGSLKNEDVVSLIVYWADKGYLKIKQEGESFTLTKLKEMGSEAKGFEKEMYKKLFKLSDEVTTEDLELTFYKTVESTKSSINTLYGYGDTRIFTKQSLGLSSWVHFLMLLPTIIVASFALTRAQQGLFFAITMGIMGGTMILIPFGSFVGSLHRWPTANPKTRTIRLLVALLFTLAFFAAFIFATLQDANEPKLPLFSVACTFVMGFCAAFATKRTQKGAQWLGKILGFRDFILTAEADRLKKLVEQNPGYFYHILPYAYVLGISDKWISNFESIALAPPDWYQDQQTLFSTTVFMHSFNGAMSSFTSSMTSSPSSSGSSGGSGFSGGGSSGGGGGGGGGGSW